MIIHSRVKEEIGYNQLIQGNSQQIMNFYQNFWSYKMLHFVRTKVTILKLSVVRF
jgi:hypothetical protein